MKSKIDKKLNRHAWRVVSIYIAAGLLWIFFSDRFAASVFDHDQLIKIQSVKEFIFISISGLFLFLLIIRKNSSIKSLFQQVKKNMRNFQATFEQAAVGIAHITKDERWIRTNKKLCDMLGYTSQEFRQLSLADIVHPGDLKKGLHMDQKILDGETKSYVAEKRYLTKSGKILFARLTKSGVFDNDGRLAYMIAILEDISDQKKAEQNLLNSLEEKKRLLSEIHHRVKNNLAVISGLLELQAFNSSDDRVKKLIKGCLMRIKSMALIHESFYETGELNHVSLDKYLEDFIKYVQNAFSEKQKEIGIIISAQPVNLNINQAIPCGLLLNELLINAYLHAFKDREKGTITIELYQKNGRVHLIITDNGAGIPESINVKKPASLGLTIVRTLSQQLNATLGKIETEGSGFHLSFALKEKRGSSSTFIHANKD